jgi:hypothetical protein
LAAGRINHNKQRIQYTLSFIIHQFENPHLEIEDENINKPNVKKSAEKNDQKSETGGLLTTLLDAPEGQNQPAYLHLKIEEAEDEDIGLLEQPAMIQTSLQEDGQIKKRVERIVCGIICVLLVVLVAI